MKKCPPFCKPKWSAEIFIRLEIARLSPEVVHVDRIELWHVPRDERSRAAIQRRNQTCSNVLHIFYLCWTVFVRCARCSSHFPIRIFERDHSAGRSSSAPYLLMCRMFCFVHTRLAVRMAEPAFSAFRRFLASTRMCRSIAFLLSLITTRCIACRFD